VLRTRSKVTIMGRPRGAKDKKKRKTRVHGWASHEEEFLISNYCGLTNKQLCEKLNKAYGTIRKRALALGLRKPCCVLPIEDSLLTTESRPGVYGFYCKENSKIYLDKDDNMGRGFICNLRLLRENSHPNQFLQQDWNCLPPTSFSIFIFQYNGNIERGYEELVRMPGVYID